MREQQIAEVVTAAGAEEDQRRIDNQRRIDLAIRSRG